MGAEGLTVIAPDIQVERFIAMGTRVELHAFGPERPGALAAARRAIEAVDDALTIHRPSPATTLNDALAKGQGASIDDPILLDALEQVAFAWTATEGMFDPAVGSGGAWPDLAFDPAERRVVAARPMAIDLGGFGKGYALDRAVLALREAGMDCAFLSAGESSVAVMGEHPVGGAWPVTIPHPLAPETTLVTLELVDAALSVSSTLATAPGRSATLRPGDDTAVTGPATTVAVEATGAMAEAMSTALLAAGPDTVTRLLTRRPGQRHVFRFAGDRVRPPSSGLLQ